MDLRRLLRYAIDRDPENIDVLPVTPHVCEMRRQNGRRPASVTVNVPDETVVNLRGAQEQRDVLVFIRVPRVVADRLETKLVLPGVDEVRVPVGVR